MSKAKPTPKPKPKPRGENNGPTSVEFDADWNRRSAKMAEELARSIESDIMKRGWPVGELLGSEPSLAEKFGVSRAVFREAVRIVEHHGAANMRRGPGGGLIVTAPDPGAAMQPVTLYLDYADVSASDLFDVRSALELTSARIAAERIDEDGIVRLRQILERERELGTEGMAQGHPHELHIAIAELTGNPAMSLLVKILTQLTFERTKDLPYDAQEFEEVHRAHAAIAEAVIAGDAALAQHRIGRHLAASTTYYYQRQGRTDPK